MTRPVTNRLSRALCAAVAVALLPALAAQAGPLDEAIDLRAEGNADSARSQEHIDELSEQTDALVHEYRGVLREIDSLQAYNEQLEELLRAQEGEAASLEQQIDRVAQAGRQLTPLMSKMIAALEEFVTLDVPFLLEERTARVAHLRELMRRADVTQSEKYRRILEAYQIENEYGRTIEAYRGQLQKDGARRTVDFLRVGRIVLLYQTLDGAEAGVWDPAEHEWATLPGSYRRAVRQGLRMARKQVAPDLIKLPIPAAGTGR